MIRVYIDQFGVLTINSDHAKELMRKGQDNYSDGLLRTNIPIKKVYDSDQNKWVTKPVSKSNRKMVKFIPVDVAKKLTELYKEAV